MNQPSAFLHTPNQGSYHPLATPPSQTEDAGVRYVAAEDATLSLSSEGRLTLSKGFLLCLNLGADSRFRLVPPRERGGAWHFDTNPRPGEGLALPQRGRAQFKLGLLPRWHFMRPAPVLVGTGGRRGLAAVSNQNVTVPLLRFRLGREVAPGYYALERV